MPGHVRDEAAAAGLVGQNPKEPSVSDLHI